MLEIKDLSFSYKTNKKTLDSISFQLEQGKMLALIGESGSGKSTLLKLIYGILQWEEGLISYNNTQLLGPKGNLVPGEKDFKYLAQDFDLMPYTSVAENVGQFLSNIQTEEKVSRVMALLDLVDMTEYAAVRTKDLSGGQKQRVALARALAQTPKVLLLDEPFSQIDSFKKNILKRAVFEFALENGISIVLATHEVEDALSYAHNICILENGKIVQQDEPSVVFNSPKNKYVASLFGEFNLFPQGSISNLVTENTDAEILVYPHEIHLSQSYNGVKVKVLKSYYVGSYYLIESIFMLQRIYFINQEALPFAHEVSLEIEKFHTVGS